MARREQTAEHQRLLAASQGSADWRAWGAYVAERAWGTVREDYSADSEPWHYFPHDHARSRAYRWNEDGLGGVCNRYQNLCLAFAFWNEQDPFLKERLFGLGGPEGNHGEDVKELYYYIDATPTHSYLKLRYEYPQVAYPYADLVAENRCRGYEDEEYEITEALADVWAEKRFFSITIEWAKAGPEDLIGRVTAVNCGPDPAPIHVLPHLWARNTWSWGHEASRPTITAEPSPGPGVAAASVTERHLGKRWWYVRVDPANGGVDGPQLLFTENDTNHERLHHRPNETPYVKDAIHSAVVSGDPRAVNPHLRGTKAAAHASATVPPGASLVVWVRFTPEPQADPFADAASGLTQRIAEADTFFDALHRPGMSPEARSIQRQAWAGLIWSQQFYHYSVELWLDGDPAQPKPPPHRKSGRNADWRTHSYHLDVMMMPDTWEYPWFAAWDLAFHAVPLAMIDPDMAKEQLRLLLREWYMHPNGQIPAYEWDFGDVNPPVHAWAAWRVYQIARSVEGTADTVFLEQMFHKLLLNFTWWVNRKDEDENNVFQGGFLGLDNIGIFDRSKPLPTGGHLDQADGTAWMAMYSLQMLRIALELARTKPAYEDVATKFFEHFIYISYALAHMGRHNAYDVSLWDPEDGFYYDVLHMPDDRVVPLRVRSLVGLIPLFAVETLDPDLLEQLPNFRRRMQWFLKYRPHLVENIASLTQPGEGGRLLLALASRDRLERVLRRMLDPEEFLSPYGLRSLSRAHLDTPYTFYVEGETMSVAYEPGVSRSGLFGGNSNWRGPVWFPTNYLMIESLRKYDEYYGSSLTVPSPDLPDQDVPLSAIAEELAQRLARLFLPDADGVRPALGAAWPWPASADGQDPLLFHEYFDGDSGLGLGASHQTGWTALVAKLLQECAGGETCVWGGSS